MSLSPPASLLVAALVMLNRPCARNRSVASLLLKRAAEDAQLSHAERDACAALADELDDHTADVPAPTTVIPLRVRHAVEAHA